jgi:hypothetical protein
MLPVGSLDAIATNEDGAKNVSVEIIATIVRMASGEAGGKD